MVVTSDDILKSGCEKLQATIGVGSVKYVCYTKFSRVFTVVCTDGIDMWLKDFDLAELEKLAAGCGLAKDIFFENLRFVFVLAFVVQRWVMCKSSFSFCSRKFCVYSMSL